MFRNVLKSTAMLLSTCLVRLRLLQYPSSALPLIICLLSSSVVSSFLQIDWGFSLPPNYFLEFCCLELHKLCQFMFTHPHFSWIWLPVFCGYEYILVASLSWTQCYVHADYLHLLHTHSSLNDAVVVLFCSLYILSKPTCFYVLLPGILYWTTGC